MKFFLGCCLWLLTLHLQAAFILSSSPHVGYHPLSIALTSKSGNTNEDLIVANGRGFTLTLLTNNGNATFTSNTSLTLPGVPVSVVSGAIVNTNRLDLMAACYGANSIIVLTNSGAGTYAVSQTLPTGGQPSALALGDLNGDSSLDIVCANAADNTVSMFTNSGSGTFQLSSVYAVGRDPVSVALVDINADNKLDILTANERDGTVSVLTNDGAGHFPYASTYSVGRFPVSLCVVDINGDALPDVVTANAGTNTLTVLTNTATGSFALMTNVGVGQVPVSVTSIGTGTNVLLACVGRSGRLTVLTNNIVSSLAIYTNIIMGINPDFVLAGAIGYDANVSLIVANGGTNTLTVCIPPTVSLNPFAASYTLSAPKSTVLTNAVLLSCVDPGGHLPLVITNAIGTNGTATISGTNVVFTPTANYIGVATAGYSITNSIGHSASGLISITYTDRPPVATSYALFGVVSNTLTIPVLTNCYDPDGDVMSITSIATTNCTASIVSTNLSVSMPGTNGTATIGFTVSDGYGGTSTAVLTLSVNFPALIPTMTSATTPSGTASAQNDDGTHHAFLAFDGNPATQWIGQSVSQTWLQYQFPAGHVARQYSIAGSANSPQWVLLRASNDGAAWTTLVPSYVDSSGTVDTITNTTAYTYYQVLYNYGVTGAPSGSAFTFQLYGY